MRAFVALLGWSVAAAAVPVHAEVAHYDIELRLEPSAHVLSAAARIKVKDSGATTIALARSFAADSVVVDGASLPVRGGQRGGLRVWAVPARSGGHQIDIRWHGTLAPIDLSLDHRGTLGRPVAASGPEGTFLPSGSYWYPVVGNLLGSYRVAVDLPAGQRAVVPGRLVEETSADARAHAIFEFAHPAEGIDVMAGPYRVESREIRTARGSEVALRTYFHPAIAGLADGYLDAVQGYLDLYEGWIGPYPFSEFSIVSSPTPTGYGMPTLTYLGESVLRLPFIRATSLGHEILHNWWGNGVYPDLSGGNWSEGLTTFMADYAFKEREGAAAAREMRLGWLRDLAAVQPGQDRPLEAFTARHHATSQIVGYDKAAMLFVMLRDRIGTEAFDRALRRFWTAEQFRVASWHDLERAFEAESGQVLGSFFTQWLERSGLPSIHIVAASREASSGAYRVRITLAQSAPAYLLRIPVSVRTAEGEEVHTLELARDRQAFEIAVRARPIRVALDPEFRVLRRLDAEELPATVRQTMVASKPVVALASPDAEWSLAARGLAERLLDGEPTIAAPGAVPRGAALVVIGRDADVETFLARNGLPERPAGLAEGGSARVWAATGPGGAPLLIVSARDPGALAPVARLLPHYGRQSFVVFAGDNVVRRGVWPSRATGWTLP